MNRRPPFPPIDAAAPAARRGARDARGALLTSIAAAALAAGLWLAPGRGAAQGVDEGADVRIRVGLPRYVATDNVEHPRVEYRDSTISLNSVCAVRKARLDPDRDPVYVNGQPIGFCCTPCPAVFSQNPERYLLDLKLSFKDPVAPKRKAIIDSSRRIRIGQDIYFFSGLSTMNRFKKNPIAYCARLTDPVTHARFRPDSSSPHVIYRGRDYWFSADSTKTRFQAKPEDFSDRQPGT